MDLQRVVEQYHLACDEFSRGNGEPVKEIYSHRADVALANPFGPPVCGWDKVSKALDYASSRFSDGECTGFERLASFESPEFATILEIERWQARVGDRKEIAPFDLRVTSIFRREAGDWKLVHRHADRITPPHPDGPLRG